MLSSVSWDNGIHGGKKSIIDAETAGSSLDLKYVSCPKAPQVVLKHIIKQLLSFIFGNPQNMGFFYQHGLTEAYQ